MPLLHFAPDELAAHARLAGSSRLSRLVDQKDSQGSSKGLASIVGLCEGKIIDVMNIAIDPPTTLRPVSCGI